MIMPMDSRIYLIWSLAPSLTDIMANSTAMATEDRWTLNTLRDRNVSSMTEIARRAMIAKSIIADMRLT